MSKRGWLDLSLAPKRVLLEEQPDGSWWLVTKKPAAVIILTAAQVAALAMRLERVLEPSQAGMTAPTVATGR